MVEFIKSFKVIVSFHYSPEKSYMIWWQLLLQMGISLKQNKFATTIYGKSTIGF